MLYFFIKFSLIPASLFQNEFMCDETDQKYSKSVCMRLLDRKFQRWLSVSDSRASKTAAPISRYVKVQTTSDSVRTFCRFILHRKKTQDNYNCIAVPVCCGLCPVCSSECNLAAVSYTVLQIYILNMEYGKIHIHTP